MPNDAMIVAVDRIKFNWAKPKRMNVYAVGVAADNNGHVLVTEPPGSARIRHRPRAGRPAIWDFAGDGFPVYQATGGLPDILVAHLLVVRDRGGLRRVGEIVKAVSKSDAAKKTIGGVSKAMTGMSLGPLGWASALGLVMPIAGLVGDLIQQKKDKVLQTISGCFYLDDERREASEFSQTIKAPDDSMEIDADVFLFDAVADEFSSADVENAELNLQADGLLFAYSPQRQAVAVP